MFIVLVPVSSIVKSHISFTSRGVKTCILLLLIFSLIVSFSSIMAARFPLGIDNVPELGPEFRMLPVHDAKHAIFMHTDGHVYSWRMGADPADGVNREYLYCAANRVFVDSNGKTILRDVCYGTPNNPCIHTPTPVMYQFHHALRAARLIVCDLFDRGALPALRRKPKVLEILTIVFGVYAPNYPNLDVGRIYGVRERAFRYIFEQREPNVLLRPWGVISGSPYPVLEDELQFERMRTPACLEAYRAACARFLVVPVVNAEPEPEPGIQDAGPALDEVYAAMRAQSGAVGVPIASFTINYVGQNGVLRPRMYNLPPE